MEDSRQNATISKRQQDKSEQIAHFQNSESDNNKKRNNSKYQKLDPQAHKLIKTQGPILQGKSNDDPKSFRQLPWDDSKDKQKPTQRITKDLQNVYNKKYGIPYCINSSHLQSQDFAEYMINYAYGEKSKYVEKQFQDWQNLQNLGGKNIQVRVNQKDYNVIQEINEKLSAERLKVHELFSKSSKQFIRKVSQDIPLKPQE